MKKFLVLGLVLLGFSRVFAGWIAEVPDQWYFLVIDGKEKVKVDSCNEALSETIIRLNNGAKRIVISSRYAAHCLPGCCGTAYTDANSAEKAMNHLQQ